MSQPANGEVVRTPRHQRLLDRPGCGLGTASVGGRQDLRGAVDADGHQVHLLAVATHRLALVLNQTEVGPTTNEIPKFSELLDDLDITGWTVTADALRRGPLSGLPSRRGPQRTGLVVLVAKIR
jgi:hypothetical protein